MKNKFIMILLFVSFLVQLNAQTLVGSIDYRAFNSNSCDVFKTYQNIADWDHRTVYGDIKKNWNQQGLELQYVYDTVYGVSKGSAFTVLKWGGSFLFKKKHKYTIKITAKKDRSYTNQMGLFVGFGVRPISSFCDGPQTIPGFEINTGFNLDHTQSYKVVNSTSYTTYTFNSVELDGIKGELNIGTFYNSLTRPEKNSRSQIIYIQKIEIFETPPPIVFQLVSSSSSIPCGSTNPVTFTVNNVNESPGTAVYNWSIAPGWKLPNGNPCPPSFSTSNNSISLIPNAYPPGSVSVVTVLNGANTPSRTSNSTLAPFTLPQNVQFNIPGNICTNTQTFSISNLPANCYSSWNLTPNNLATTTNTSNSSLNLSLAPNASGEMIVNTTIHNSCGQTSPFTKKVWIGLPRFQGIQALGNSTGFDPSEPNLSLDGVGGCNIIALRADFSDPSILEYKWEKVTPDLNWQTYTNTNFFQLIPNCNRGVEFKVQARNQCGWTPIEDISYYMSRCTMDCETGSGTPNNNVGDNFILYPNPVTDGNLNVSVLDQAPWFTETYNDNGNGGVGLSMGIGIEGPNGTYTNFNPIVQIEIYNNIGINVLNYNDIQLPNNLNVGTLTQGTYTVHIKYFDHTEFSTFIKD